MGADRYMAAIAEADRPAPGDPGLLKALGDASDFTGLGIELIRAKKPERAEEALMKALTKIEEARTIANGGK